MADGERVLDGVRNAPRVALLDSGVGGLTILEGVQAALPSAHLFYCADTANFPYGTKTEPEIARIVVDAAARLAQRTKPDVVVIACNTATTSAIARVRETLGLPIVGVVPAVKPAAAASRTGVVGLLATTATVTGPYTDELIRTHAAERRVVRVGTAKLVQWAEAKLRGRDVPLDELRAEIAPLWEGETARPDAAEAPAGRVDVVVLGCTHFPLLLPELRALAPWPVTWMDSATAVAARVASVVAEVKRPVRRASASTSAEATTSPAPERVAFVTRLDASAAAMTAAWRRFQLTFAGELG
jgi:glutamate racemase